MPVDEQRRGSGHLGPHTPHDRMRAAREELHLATAEPSQFTSDPLGGRAAVGVVRRARRHRGDAQEVGELAEQPVVRSEEHTSELQSLAYLVCRLLLEKKKNNITQVCDIETTTLMMY